MSATENIMRCIKDAENAQTRGEAFALLEAAENGIAALEGERDEAQASESIAHLAMERLRACAELLRFAASEALTAIESDPDIEQGWPNTVSLLREALAKNPMGGGAVTNPSGLSPRDHPESPVVPPPHSDTGQTPFERSKGEIAYRVLTQNPKKL